MSALHSHPVDAWSNFRSRTLALDAWLAREEGVAAGTISATDPSVLGYPDRDTLLEALFQRWTATLESALDVQLDRGAAPLDALRVAFAKAAARRPGDWQALRREAAHPVVAELTRRQHLRLAGSAGLVRGGDVEAAVAEVAAVAGAVRPSYPQVLRGSRARGLLRVLRS